MTEEERKYPIGGFAPGNYHCYCSECKDQFIGDKMAVQCEPCAIDMMHDVIINQLEELQNTIKLQAERNQELNDSNRKILMANTKLVSEALVLESYLRKVLCDNIDENMREDIKQLFDKMKNG